MAKFFHFQPSELMEFDSEDIYFWMDRLEEVQKAEKKALEGK